MRPVQRIVGRVVTNSHELPAASPSRTVDPRHEHFERPTLSSHSESVIIIYLLLEACTTHTTASPCTYFSGTGTLGVPSHGRVWPQELDPVVERLECFRPHQDPT